MDFWLLLSSPATRFTFPQTSSCLLTDSCPSQRLLRISVRRRAVLRVLEPVLLEGVDFEVDVAVVAVEVLPLVAEEALEVVVAVVAVGVLPLVAEEALEVDVAVVAVEDSKLLVVLPHNKLIDINNCCLSMTSSSAMTFHAFRDKFSCQSESIVQGDDVQLDRETFWQEYFVLPPDLAVFRDLVVAASTSIANPTTTEDPPFQTNGFQLLLQNAFLTMLDYRFPHSMNAILVSNRYDPDINQIIFCKDFF